VLRQWLQLLGREMLPCPCQAYSRTLLSPQLLDIAVAEDIMYPATVTMAASMAAMAEDILCAVYSQSLTQEQRDALLLRMVMAAEDKEAMKQLIGLRFGPRLGGGAFGSLRSATLADGSQVAVKVRVLQAGPLCRSMASRPAGSCGGEAVEQPS
jgi:hypothetical protein